MSTNHIVDLSADDYNDEIMRKRINRKKMTELRKYIPFLEFIFQLDPVKYHNYKKLLRWLREQNEFPAQMAAKCESNIIAKYNKLKNVTEIPAAVAEVFSEKDAILISDEDDEQPSNERNDRRPEDPEDLETIVLEDDEPKDVSSKKDNENIQTLSINDLNAEKPHSNCTSNNEKDNSTEVTPLTTTVHSTTKKDKENLQTPPIGELNDGKDHSSGLFNNATDQNRESTSLAGTAQSTAANQSQANQVSKNESIAALEEGEILSESEEVKENTDKNDSLKNLQKLNIKISESVFSTPSEDDVINQDLFRRIDCFDDDDNDSHDQIISNTERADDARMSILRQKNLESDLFLRRSPKIVHSASLSTISSEDMIIERSHKKKKKKRKHKKKNYAQQDRYPSEAENDEKNNIRTKAYPEEAHIEEEKSMSKRKPKKSSKKQSKKHRHSRSLYISDDEEDIVAEKTNKGTISVENANDSQKKHDAIFSSNLSEPPTVVLSDSNDEEVSQLSDTQNNNVVSPIVPSPKLVENDKPKSPIALTSNTETDSREKASTTTAMDINNMGLKELNDIYNKLCDATGIQLEELLIDLVGKSSEENKQSTPIDNVKTSEPVAQTNSESVLPQENSNVNNIDNSSMTQYQERNPNMFALHQYPVNYQQSQSYQIDTFNQQMQENQSNIQCQLPGQFPYRHTLRPGLNLNDPRIVQKLKQIKDSPIHNISIRESASLLMNRHAAMTSTRSLPVPEVTSKTATTYGEHKRLRELERKKELERQNSKKLTITANEGEEGRITKDKVVEHNEKDNSNRIERCFSTSSVTDSGIEISGEPKSVALSREPSQSEDSSLSSEKRTKSRENNSSGRITPFEMEKVVDIVLKAIGHIDDDTSKKLKEKLQCESNALSNSQEEEEVSLQKSSVDMSIEKETEHTMKRKSRPASKSRKSTNSQSATKKSHTKSFGLRELNNLSCTFVDYQEIFERNVFGGYCTKRRSSSNLTREQSSPDTIADMSDDKKSPVRAAPIKRRRQTCSALHENTKPKEDSLPPLKIVFRRISEGGSFSVQCDEPSNSSVSCAEIANKNHHEIVKFTQTVTVKVKKLSLEEIKTKTRRIHPNEDICNKPKSSKNCPEPSPEKENETKSNSFSEGPVLVPYSSEPVDCSSKTCSKPLRHLNVNINMTLNSTKTCAICNKRSPDLTSHYVLQHKTESYISRLTAAEIELLESQIKLATLNRKRYKINCVFCQDELEVHNFVHFHAHFSYHTGEYGFKCDVCEIVKPYREDIKSHQLRNSRCRKGKIRTNYLYQSDLKIIYLYVCKLCNFVQLNEANIHKHQRDHHFFRFEESQHVKKCIICALNDDVQVINEFLPSNETDSLEAEYADSNEQQEQEFVHEFPLDIKDVLVSIENENTSQNKEIKEFKCEGSAKETACFTSTDKQYKQPPKSVDSVEHLQLNDTNKSINGQDQICVTIDGKNNVNDMIQSQFRNPELLLGQLHGSESDTSVMTVIHCRDQIQCNENHQPFEETVEIKPNIKTNNSEELEVSASSPSPVKQITYRKVIAGVNFFGLYKCMVGQCWFSTNEAEKYIQHVDTHKSDDQKQILYCAYCSNKSSCSKQLVKHIRTRHSMSLYQCSICTYRSMLPGNVCSHLEINHKDSTDEKCIFKCVGRVRTFENKLAALKEKIKENINGFTCKDCPAQFYSLSSIKLHHETTRHNVNLNSLTKYACIFCEVQSNSLVELQHHLVALHPNDMCYVVERELNSEADKDSVENLKIVNITPPIIEGFKVRVAEFKEEVSASVETINTAEMSIIKCLKPLLDLLTEQTGIYRSELYKCTVCSGTFFTYDLWLNHVQARHKIKDKVTCPYCPRTVKLEEVVVHFDSHLRHEYFCLHCIRSFRSKLDLEDHFNTIHGNFEKTIEKALIYPNLRKYYVMKGVESSVTDWISILESFHETLRQGYIKRLFENRCSEWCYELGEFCFDDAEIPQLALGAETVLKCLVNSCEFESSNEDTFDLHLNQHTVPRNYHCPYCNKNLQTSWECIKDHCMLHRNHTIYLCCVCKFVHHKRSVVAEHIKKLHNSRDVPVITLWRDTIECRISLSMVMQANKITFITTTACFCCGQGLPSGKAVMNHLIDVHGLAMCSKCELCEDILLNRDEILKHGENHEGIDFKIRYDILTPSSYNLFVRSISPLRADVKLKVEKRLLKDINEMSPKRIKLDKEFCINIKEELTKPGSEDNDKSPEKPSCSIKCVNIEKLVSNRTTNSFVPMPNQLACDLSGSTSDKGLEKRPLDPQPPKILYIQTNNNLSVNTNTPCQPLVSTNPCNTLNYSTQTTNLGNLHHRPEITQCPTQPSVIVLPKTNSNFMLSQNYLSNRPNLFVRPVSQSYLNGNIQSTATQQTTTQFQPQPQQSLTVLTRPLGELKFGTNGTNVEIQNTILNIKLPHNQGIATVSRAPPLPASSYNTGPHCSRQPNETETSSNNVQTNSRSHQTGIPTCSQRTETMEEIANKIDLTYPEIMPVCGICRLECTSFLLLWSHFNAVHEKSFRFLFGIVRRVKCVYCHYRGSISSFTAHNETFHPGKAFKCRSVINLNRCGICHDIFRSNPATSDNSHPICNCPGKQRAIADCISLDMLQLLQKYGKKCFGFLCEVCRTLFHSETGCKNHFKVAHDQNDFIPKMWPIKNLLFSCFICETTAMTLRNLIMHISATHNINSSTASLENRLSCYKKIRLIYPRGFVVALRDLSNSGYDEENLKNDIQTVDNISRS